MGLDMYAMVTNAPLGDMQVDFVITKDGRVITAEQAREEYRRRKAAHNQLEDRRDGAVLDPISKEVAVPVQDQELHYWRKHPDLHSWMYLLYRGKGGASEDFNQDQVRIMPEDLDRLEVDLKNRQLPRGEGFFWGTSTDEDLKDDLEFVKKARAALAEGLHVYYTSWW